VETFFPSSTALALINVQGYGIAKHPKETEIFLRRAVSAVYIPATWMLCQFMCAVIAGWPNVYWGNSVTIRLAICLDFQSGYGFFYTNIQALQRRSSTDV
jgi:hypothetical protein